MKSFKTMIILLMIMILLIAAIFWTVSNPMDTMPVIFSLGGISLILISHIIVNKLEDISRKKNYKLSSHLFEDDSIISKPAYFVTNTNKVRQGVYNKQTNKWFCLKTHKHYNRIKKVI